ncbi:MAG: hypothetical protein K0Q55_1707 [Verrucomicrobia bacterium]|jgi:hypothetical protein|nr:hypothetical protein [Verrucomicrobiota bacterium]
MTPSFVPPIKPNLEAAVKRGDERTLGLGYETTRGEHPNKHEFRVNISVAKWSMSLSNRYLKGAHGARVETKNALVFFCGLKPLTLLDASPKLAVHFT